MFAHIVKRSRNAVVLLSLILALPPIVAATDDIPRDVRDAIESVLQQRVADLLKEKDAEGVQIKRGAYSRAFKKIDDSTYEVGFNQDTVQKYHVDRDQMKVERYVYTVKKTNGKWAIADQKLADTYEKLYRPFFGGGFRHFDKFSFEKEGIKVTATNGDIYAYSRKGEPVGFRLVANDLAYNYVPPADAGFYGSAVSHEGLVLKEIAKKNPQDVNFDPLWLRLTCDPNTCKQIYDTAFQGLAAPPSEGAGGGGGGGGGADSKLRAIYDDELRDSKKDDRDYPFSGFFPDRDPEQRTWRLFFKRDGVKDQFFSIA